jgi:hypothetical protein
MDPSTLAAQMQPDALRATLDTYADDLRTAGEHHHQGGMTTVRRATHAGHEIVIETAYKITVDGEPFDAQLSVGNSGQVHYHGLPTQAFPSAVDLVKRAIDRFPGDFGRAGSPGEHDHDDDPEHDDHPEHGHGHEHEHPQGHEHSHDDEHGEGH